MSDEDSSSKSDMYEDEETAHPDDDSEDESEHDGDDHFDDDADPVLREAAFDDLKADFSRQLGLASDRQNAMLQSIGILVAFASILFVQLVLIDWSSSDGIQELLFGIATACVTMCVMTGLWTVINWNNFSLSGGAKISYAVSKFNKGEYEDVETDIVNGIIRAYRDTIDDNTILKKRVSYMTMMLLGSIAVIVVGWLHGIVQ